LTSNHVRAGYSRLLSLAAMVGSLALLAAVIFMLWPADPSDTAGVDGETVGWVSKVDSNTIHVNSGPFGGGIVPLQVTRSTRITIGSKEGWFEDIRPGGQVKVHYQTVNGNRLARTVELLVEEGPKRPLRPEARVKSASGTGGTDQTPARTTATSTPAAPTPKPIDAVSKPPAVAPSAPAPPAVVPPAPAPPAAAAPAHTPAEARPAARVERPHAQATEPAVPRSSSSGGRAPTENGTRSAEPARPQPPVVPPPARPAETPRPADTEGTDGAAAVDWLLKNRR
jgi:hypothetical protein